MKVKKISQQRPLEQNLGLQIETALNTIRGKEYKSYLKLLRTFYNQLRLVIYYLSNYIDDVINAMTLGQYVATVSLPAQEEQVWLQEPFGTINLVYLLSFFSFIEERIYDEIKEELYPIEMRKSREHVSPYEVEAIHRGYTEEIIPPTKDFVRLLKKFALRCVPELSNFDEPLREALKRYGMMCDEFEGFYESLQTNLPESIKVLHLQDLINSLQSIQKL
eukprot:TRINITY_DN5207_c0_g1_i3.p1 TRINITY_DN5207_c0_g1~~TRINITY_DN5207_c0_g1_i3.p1  ORF type:complete len:220 (-),score=37.61 TRINITY_DN5207_c0_g1_i3:39-698(-)